MNSTPPERSWHGEADLDDDTLRLEKDLLVNTPTSGPTAASPPLPAVFQRYQAALDSALRDRLSDDSSFVYSMLRYNMGWADIQGAPVSAAQGKALRPTLCLLTCEAVCGDFSLAVPAAAAFELVHNFSLIHDEVQDRDESRRHRPTLWTVWGDAKALSAGNVLRVVADVTIDRLQGEDASFRKVHSIGRVMTEASLEMIEGQYLDVSYEGRSDIGMKSYLDMIARKTGALIRSPMEVGAIMGANDQSVVDAFRECGRALGLVFQIRDDVLGIWGDEKTTGKPVGADIRQRKNSFPIVHAMSNADGARKRILDRVYDQESISDEDVDTVLEIMDGLGTRGFAHSLATEHCERGLECLEGVEIPPDARNDIEEMAVFLLIRQH